MPSLPTRGVLLIVLGAVLSVARLLAQAPVDPKTPAFDVASVKVSTSLDQPSGSYVAPGGRYVAQNMTLRALIKVAYGVHDSQIVGGPAWIDTDRWDVNAKAEGYPQAAAFRDVARLMVRPLLADRFKLSFRREPRELPVYAIVVARANGQLGPQFRPNDGHDCAGPAPPIPPASGAKEPAVPLPCGADMFRPGHLAARAMTLDNMLVAFNRFANSDRVVIDRTGLTGKFDWEIQWTPQELTAGNAPPPEGPSLFEAFREQAGLKLEARKDTVEVLLIDHVERPTPD
jgi:uncharacterized protein (TIGR03435 family)